MAVLKVYNGVEWVSIASNLGSASFNIDQSGGTSDTYGVLSGAINSANTTFTTSQSIYVTGTLTVYLNGQLQIQGSSEDWTETSPAAGTFDFIVAPTTGDEITVTYQSISSTIGNADMVDGIHASTSATANQLLSLDSNSDLDLGANNLINLSNVSATVSDQDLLFNINDGGTDRTAIQIHGDIGSVSMPRQSHVVARASSDQVIATSSLTTVVFGTEDLDVLGEYDNTTGIFTALEDGTYLVSAGVCWQNPNANKGYYIQIGLTGDNHKGRTITLHNSTANHNIHTQNCVSSVWIPAGGTIRINVYQNSGGNENIQYTAWSADEEMLSIAKIA